MLTTGDAQNPFQKAEEPNLGGSSDDDALQLPKSDSNQPTAQPPSVGDTAHPTEQGRYEQAASVAPEGQGSDSETPGEHAYRNIG